MEKPDSESNKSRNGEHEKDVGDTYANEHVDTPGLPSDPDEGLSEEERATIVSKSCSKRSALDITEHDHRIRSSFAVWT